MNGQSSNSCRQFGAAPIDGTSEAMIHISILRGLRHVFYYPPPHKRGYMSSETRVRFTTLSMSCPIRDAFDETGVRYCVRLGSNTSCEHLCFLVYHSFHRSGGFVSCINIFTTRWSDSVLLSRKRKLILLSVYNQISRFTFVTNTFQTSITTSNLIQILYH